MILPNNMAVAGPGVRSDDTLVVGGREAHVPTPQAWAIGRTSTRTT